MSTPHQSEISIIHLHWIAFARDLAIVFMGIIFPPMIVVILLPKIVSYDIAASITHVLPLITLLWLLLLWMLVATVWMRYYLSLWILTEKNLVFVNQINFFVREVDMWNMITVTNATASHEGPLETSLDYGSIWVKTPEAKGGEYVLMSSIPEPDSVSESITHLIKIKEVSAVNTDTQTQHAQEQLLRSISHEMKAHLTRSQMTFSAIVSGDFGEVPENLKNIASAGLADTREGVETVMNILNSSNFKKGTITFDKKPFNLTDAVRESIDKLRAEAEKKGIILRFNVADGHCFMEGDKEKLEHHVFRNLIDNAIRYTPAGAVDITFACTDALATFSVVDTGVGITPTDMQHLFTEGGKGADSSRTNPQSTGYGLFVAKMVVEGHNGKIWAESDGPGTGSRFYVTLPLHMSAAAKAE